MNPSSGCLHGVREVAQRLDLLAIDLLHGEIGEVVVADRAVCRQHLSHDHDAAISFREQFRLKAIQIDQALRRFLLPVGAPFLEILPRKLLKNQATENEIRWRLIKIVGRDHVIVRVPMVEDQIELHRFASRVEFETAPCRRQRRVR